MSDLALDASAVLAYLQQEPGAARVETALLEDRCYLLTVNLAEVLTRLADWKIPPDAAEERIAGMDMVFVPFDREMAGLTAALRQTTRALGLSLADRACLALAQKMAIPVLTADRAWLDLKTDIRVEFIRPPSG